MVTKAQHSNYISIVMAVGVILMVIEYSRQLVSGNEFCREASMGCLATSPYMLKFLQG